MVIKGTKNVRAISFALGLTSITPLMLMLTVVPTAAAPLTYQPQIAQIFQGKCTNCHQASGIAPFSLEQYSDVTERLEEIKKAITDRLMPPWLAEDGFGKFHTDETLSDEQRGLLLQWIAEGAVKGSDSTGRDPAPPAAKQPDLIVKPARPYELAPGGEPFFRNFVIPLNLSQRRFVSAIELRPHARAAVAHATITQDMAGFARTLSEMDANPGFAGIEGCLSAGDRVIGWSPQSPRRTFENGDAWTLESISELVVRLYLVPTDKTELIQPEIALFFQESAPKTPSATLHLVPPEIVIPANESRYSISHHLKLNVPTRILSVIPHAGSLCREIKVFGLLPEKSPAPLIWIRKWNPIWQNEYTFSEPVVLPAETEIRVQFFYDNTTGDPEVPAKTVVWGPKSGEEYAGVWFRIAPEDSSRLSELQRAFAKIETDSLADGYRFTLTGNKGDYDANSRLGHLLVGQNNPTEATRHLDAALKTNPDSWNVIYNQGLSLVSQGKTKAAGDRFDAALKLHPNYAPARKGLASMLAMTGQLEASVSQFQTYLKQKPADYEVRNNLGVILVRLGRFEEAEASYRHALKTAGPNSGVHGNLAKLLADTDRRSEAETVLKNAIPAVAKAVAQKLRLQLALIVFQDGRKAKAQDIVKKVLEIAPDNAEAKAAFEFLSESDK